MSSAIPRSRGGVPKVPSLEPESPGHTNGAVTETLESLMASSQEQIESASRSFADTRQAVMSRVEAIEKVAGPRTANVRENILKADFGSVKQDSLTSESDVAKAMEALHEVGVNLDEVFKSFAEPNATEHAIINAAKERVSKLEATRPALQAALEAAKTKWFMKSAAIQKATDAMTQLEVEIKAAQEKVGEAETKVAGMIRQRLLSANLQGSLEHFNNMANKTVEVLRANEKMLVAEANAKNKDRQFALEQKTAAARQLEEIGKKLIQKELDLKQAEEELLGLENGSSDHAQKDKEISDLRVEVKNLRGDKAQALSYFQSKERGCEHIAITHMGLIEQRDTIRSRIAKLVSDTKNRLSVYSGRLSIMKAVTSQQFDEQLGKVGDQLDHDSAMYAAKTIVAAGNALMAGFERQPDTMKELAEIVGTIAQHQQTMRERAAAVEENMRKNNGIDAAGASFFSYEKPVTESATVPTS